MITFPICKINLGLNIVSKRPDGYHNLQTVFYPVPLTDAIEINVMHDNFPSDTDCDLKISNLKIEGNEQDNLVVKAYKLLKQKYDLPRIHTHLYKGIPTQAGMGGGSADCAYMIRLLNDAFHLKMSKEEMIADAAKLGADCPFFILSTPAYAEGIGEQLTPVTVHLDGMYIAVVRPDIPVPTREAFAHVKPAYPKVCCKDVVSQPIAQWKDNLTNDFEQSVFALHPEIAAIKQKLYDMGAVFALMSGSGSSVFGLFDTYPHQIEQTFSKMFTCVRKL